MPQYVPQAPWYRRANRSGCVPAAFTALLLFVCLIAFLPTLIAGEIRPPVQQVVPMVTWAANELRALQVTAVPTLPGQPGLLPELDRTATAWAVVQPTLNAALTQRPLNETPRAAAAPPRAATATPVPVLTKGDANLRSGPGTDYTKVGTVTTGQTLQVLARNAAGDWYQLADGSWVFADLLAQKPVVNVAEKIPTVTP
jgi:hypothetical protein